MFARQNEYFTCRYVRLRFSSRKSFHGIDRSNGHATVKPINLQIRCKMNYWSRSHVLKEITVDAFHARSKTTQNIRTKRKFFFLKHTISKFLVNDEILTINSKRGNFSHLERKIVSFFFIRISILSFTVFLLIVVDRLILSKIHETHVTPSAYLLYHLFPYGFSQQSVQEIPIKSFRYKS